MRTGHLPYAYHGDPGATPPPDSLVWLVNWLWVPAAVLLVTHVSLSLRGSGS